MNVGDFKTITSFFFFNLMMKFFVLSWPITKRKFIRKLKTKFNRDLKQNSIIYNLKYNIKLILIITNLITI